MTRPLSLEILVDDDDEATVVEPSPLVHAELTGLVAARALIPEPARAPAPRGRIVVVFGCKGGVGATTLAVNLGVAAAGRLARGAVVVDFDVQMGDALGALDLKPGTLLGELVGQVGELETPALRRRLAVHRSGVCVVSQAGRLEALGTLELEQARELLCVLSRHFDAVVVDGVADFGDLALAALDVADTVVLVVTQDVAALRRAARCVSVLRRLRVPEHKLALVVNRHARRGGVRVGMIAEVLALPVAARVANDFPTVMRAIDGGRPLAEAAPRARVTRDVATLARRLLTEPPGRAPAARTSFFRRLFGRKARSRGAP
ncbi:MAG TPA: AAA family ATPase [Polyangia bacterium]|nr:AAA family ATPase [Polyangia bacterium]